MTEQLLGWLGSVGAVLAAIAFSLNRLTSVLKALAGVIDAARALRRAVRSATRGSARPGREAIQGKRTRKQCRLPNNQL